MTVYNYESTMKYMQETFETAGRQLLETCIVDLTDYKRAVKTVDSPAVRKLLESIIAQKSDQLLDIQQLTGYTAEISVTGEHQSSAPMVETTSEGRTDPEALLKELAARENSFAQGIRSIATKTGSEEDRNALFACAERSRKFASWSQDHLDLLGLF